MLEDLEKDIVGEEQEKKNERQEYLKRIQELPFVVESVDSPGTNFIDVQHLSHQIIIRLNTRHRFYWEMWEPIHQIAAASPGSIDADRAHRVARLTLEALTLLAIAYGKAESMHETPRERYEDLWAYWGQFINSLLGKVKGVV